MKRDSGNRINGDANFNFFNISKNKKALCVFVLLSGLLLFYLNGLHTLDLR